MGTATAKKSGLKKVVDFFIRYCMPWAVTAILLSWMLHKVNIHQVYHIMRYDCNYWWIALMMFFSVANMTVRGIRWEMQLKEAGVGKVSVMASSNAIYGAYALNLLFPRLGEVWRCIFIAKRQKAPFTVVLGTDLGDRCADMLCVIVTIVLALLLCHHQMIEFTHAYAVGRIIGDVFESPWLWIGLAVAGGTLWFLLRYEGNHRWVEKMRSMLKNLWVGFVALFHVKPIGAYLWLTVVLWLFYYLETYICFFAFPFTRTLISQAGDFWGLGAGLICLVFGSCSTLIPSNGGLGPWTIAIAFSLELYGVSAENAGAFALAVWCMQTLILVVMGIFAAFFTRKSLEV